ncbi:MAG: DNA repair protein RadA [Alphaproteobacteria bacterium]|nr:DNA repair protein RadA [Alphaproteobacteria bacterium]
MARPQRSYVCQSCGSTHNKWSGKCEGCGEWNTVVEEIMADSPPKGLGRMKGRVIEFHPLSGTSEKKPRRTSGIEEFDRVTGGGLVAGSALLIGGDPGIGKSTILLQATARLAKDAKCAYISGEEAIDQVRMRAARLGLADAPVELAAATNVRDIIHTLEKESYDVLVIDSIQTMYLDNLDSAPGTVAQVRACAQELIRTAKRRGTCVFLVGHVTKEGQIAGPRVLEHMVDTVLYFEGDRGHTFRILRAVKNRFGPTDEIGVFEMGEDGLQEVKNPSALFLSQRQQEISGSAVFAGMEGTRPVLVEVQALVAPSPLGTPRRAVIGWDQSRLSMVLAVLEARCGIAIGPNDVYLSVAGGLRVTEPAADLAVAAALASSLTGVPVPSDMVIFGEVGLSGEIRNVGQADNRLKEASKLGFKGAMIPDLNGKKTPGGKDMRLMQVKHLKDILPLFTEDN